MSIIKIDDNTIEETMPSGLVRTYNKKSLEQQRDTFMGMVTRFQEDITKLEERLSVLD